MFERPADRDHRVAVNRRDVGRFVLNEHLEKRLRIEG
jgi:hypothetical protein